jgi:hypothetical protein
METLTPQEKEKLIIIVNDKYAVGAFTGMVYNATVQQTEINEDFQDKFIKNLKKALQAKIIVEELSK